MHNVLNNWQNVIKLWLIFFDNPATAGDSERDKAIIRLATELTENPSSFSEARIQELKNLGLENKEILDLIHSVAIFGWANRLMLNLGEAVHPEK